MINGNLQFKPTIVCRYSCQGCGLKDHEFTVVARSESEPIHHFMERLAFDLALDHARAAPRCNLQAATELYIPIGRNGALGAPRAN